MTCPTKPLTILAISLTLLFAGVIVSESSEGSSTHSIEFRVNGGSGTETTWVVADGGCIELPTRLFTRSGYILSGWGTSSTGGTVYDAGSEITVRDDLVLYANWTEEPSTDAYKDENAPSTVEGKYSYTPVSNGNADSDEWLVFLTAVMGGYGWSVSQKPDWMSITYENRTFTASGVPTSSGNWIVKIRIESAGSPFYIYWTVNVPSTSDSRGTVTFDTGGYGNIPSLSGPIGTVVALPGEDAVSRSGYVLSGWDITVTEGTGTFPLSSYLVLDGDYIAKAHWLAEANVVILDGSGQMGNEIDAFVGYEQETITLPSEGYAKEGYTFNGWRLTSEPDSIYAPGFLYTIHGATYMTAYYVRSGASTVEVEFEANGGSGSLNMTVEPGRSVVLPDLGFSNETELVGWLCSSDSETYLPGESVAVIENTMFSAVWGTTPAEVVTVSFDLNGGRGSASVQILKNGDTAVQPSDPSRSAHIFTGWYKVGGGRYDFSEPVTNSITLRADWEEHFIRSYEGNVVVITMAQKYSAGTTVVDWGDGTSSTGSVSFTHSYSGESSGTITVTTQHGVSGGSVSSSVQYSVQGTADPGDDPTIPEIPESDDDGILHLMLFGLILVIIGAALVWRLS